MNNTSIDSYPGKNILRVFLSTILWQYTTL